LKKQLLLYVLIAGVSIALISWGYAGHYKINQASGLSFNAEMAQFNDWIDILADHASDADDRKAWDPDEGPKHYIDIDNYSEFISQGSIPQTWDSVVAAHGAAFVMDNGILPWATLITFDSLQNSFQRQDWEKAKLFASDLGHYVADGHMPLHITRNYNGQYTGNSGIHSRYESTMINAYIAQIEYEGYETEEIDNVSQYVFDYLYASYVFVDSILAADNEAKSVAGNTNSTLYKQTLWAETKDFTIPLFSEASHALSELIYTAWKRAGSPVISPDFIESKLTSEPITLIQNFPNPFTNATSISYHLTKAGGVELFITDISGRRIATLVNENQSPGEYRVTWEAPHVEPGIYLVALMANNDICLKKMIRSR